ncbi:MAG: hypothetical protein ACT4QB_10105 [Gammaproteobacteria bacterium]
MFAERLILETDPQGNLKEVPKLPPNRKVEAIFLVLEECEAEAAHRISPVIAGRGKILGDIISAIVPECDWEVVR